MRFQVDESAPLSQVGLRRLPTIDQPDVDVLAEERDTRAFRAALRGMAADQGEEAAPSVTAPLLSSDLSSRKPASATRRQRWVSRRQMVVVVVALLLLLGVGATLLDSRFGVLAFGLGANPNPATPTPMKASGPQAGIASLPATPTTPPTTTPTAKPPVPVLTPHPKTPTPTPPPSYSTTGPYSNSTPPPGYTSFAVTEPANDPWASSFGQCTWWAQDKRQDENFSGFGNAMNWANAARARGYTVTSTPVANATVVFAPGVQGASIAGHVSHVEKVLTGGWVLVSEMNFYWNGGGFARVDYRYIHQGAGVWFIH